MKKILVLHTGGTISMSEDDNGAVSPNASNPLNQFNNPFNQQLELVTEDIFNIPSPHVGPTEMLALEQRILQAHDEKFDGVVITHGTDTLEETAYFLDITIPHRFPIVLTGAMRSANEIGSDGLHNFQTAIRTAASDQAYGKGVLVVMNDEIHTARYVTKTHTTNVSTFRTPTFGPIGIVSKNNVTFFEELLNHRALPINHVIDHVYLLKGYAGMDAELLEFIASDASHANGLVIEALGAGNLPPRVLENLQKIIDKNIPVVLVSRCFNGVAEDVYDYEGGGVQLKKMGVTFCRGLNGQKARIKLLVGLSAGLSGQELAHFVDNAIS